MRQSWKFITILLLAFVSTGLHSKKIETKMLTDERKIETNNLALHYLVREPKVKSKKRKGIILLHGLGSNEKDLFGLTSHLPEDFVVVSARGPYSLGGENYAWYNVNFSTGKPVFNAGQEAQSRELIMKFIEQVKQQYKLDEVYLGGFSQGAIMSYSIGLTHPKSVRGIVILSGRLLTEIQPLVKPGKDLTKLRVFVSHGTQDQMLGITYARDARKFLQQLQVELNYKEYVIAHQISPEVLTDLRKWLDSGQ